MQEFCNAIEDMAGWSVDGVCDFLREIGCKEYEKVGSAANCACFLHVYSLGFERLYRKRWRAVDWIFMFERFLSCMYSAVTI